MKYVLAVLFILFISISYGQESPKQQQLDFAHDLIFKKHKPADLIKEVALVHQKLKANHPNLYWYISKKKLDKKFDSLSKTFTIPLTSLQFRAALMTVLNVLGDGHLQLNIDVNGGPNHPACQQLVYKVIGNRLFVVKNSSSNNNIKEGDEVISINDKPVKQIIENLTSSITSDGYGKAFSLNILNKGLFGYRYYLDNNLPDTIIVETKNANSILTTYQLISYNLQKFSGLLNQTTDNSNSIYAFEFPSRNIAIAKIGGFVTDYETYFINSLKTAKKLQTNNLIIDLRDNPGGSIALQKKMFSYLIDKKTKYLDKKSKGYITKSFDFYLNQNNITKKDFEKDFEPVEPADNLNFKGKIYVLINGGSFSASSLFSANLKGNKNVILVGSETGGGANGCTACIFDNCILQTTKLTLHYGLVGVKPHKLTKTKGHGVMPDIEIKYTLQDYLDNKDLEMEWVMGDIEKNK